MEIKDSEIQFKDTSIFLPDEKNLFVIIGSNNSGKSTFLRSVVKTFGKDAYRVDVNRTILRGEGAQNKGYHDNAGGYLSNLINQADDNTQKDFQVLQDYFGLKTAERVPIMEWYNAYFPNKIYEEREDEENNASPMFLKINGFPITKQGSGMRATLEIFVKLFDPKVKFLCIDEPELGLEPKLQKFLFQAIKDKAGVNKKIFIATHSHHFLDFDDVSTNFICERGVDTKISLSVVDDLRGTIFTLLGNTLSSYLLPEKILILEGPSDEFYIKKVLAILNKKDFVVHSSGSIDSTTYAINAVTQFLRFNTSLSVYKEKTYVVVDKPVGVKDKVMREWSVLLGDKNRICLLPMNGIEYYYPEQILRQIFNTKDSAVDIIKTFLNTGEYNGIQKSKTDLSRIVASKLTLQDLDDKGNSLFEFIKKLP